jgi:hypothetical protein
MLNVSYTFVKLRKLPLIKKKKIKKEKEKEKKRS